MIGTRMLTRRYSRSDASVSIAIASTPGIDLAGREADRLLLELRGDVALGVDLDEQHALADAARASSAVAAAIVLLPTPPLPVKNRQRRSSRSGPAPSHGQRR